MKITSMHHDSTYLAALSHILENGKQRTDRTGTGTISVFGYQMRFDLSKGFPLLTTKKVHFKSVVGELLWFLSGCLGGINKLKYTYGVTIWDEWLEIEKAGHKIPYANMVKWRAGEWQYLNQLERIIQEIKTNAHSRRLVVSNWNAPEIHQQRNVLDPCHVLFQFYVSEGKLSCQMYQRSADFFLGVPFNIASYALLTHLVAKECGLEVGEFVHTFGDAHIYLNHIEQVKIQLERTPLPSPTILLNDVPSIWEYTPADIQLINYLHHPAIKAPISI